MEEITKKLRIISKSRNRDKIIYGKPKRKNASIFIDSEEK